MGASSTADVVVVGAGILGAAAAYELASAGLRVVVLERNAANREGSGTTAGNLHIQAIHPSRPGQPVPADIERFLPLQVAASQLWDDLEERLGGSVELRREGGFMVAETAEQAAELRRKRVFEHALGLHTELVTGEEARRELPLLADHIVAANWCALDGYANPLLVTMRFLDAARRANARILEHHPVTGINQNGDSYQVQTPQGQWTTPWVVNVAGPWMGHIAEMVGVQMAMSPVAIQMHVTMRAPHMMHHLVQHVSEGLSVKQVRAGNFLIGGGWPAAEFADSGRSPVSPSSIVGNLRQAGRVLPVLATLRLLRAWAGPLAATPDEMPVIGQVSSRPGLVIAGGTYAFTLAPLWAQVIRELVEGKRPSLDLEDLSPDRLIEPTPAIRTQQ